MKSSTKKILISLFVLLLLGLFCSPVIFFVLVLSGNSTIGNIGLIISGLIIIVSLIYSVIVFFYSFSLKEDKNLFLIFSVLLGVISLLFICTASLMFFSSSLP